MAAATSRPGRRFQLILIKPSHYDDDGYVIQWVVSAIPSNSLAVAYSLALDVANRRLLGPDIDFDVVAIDETNTRVRIGSIIRGFQRNGGLGLVGLVGVQSNQFPRALDIARPFRAAGIQVVLGGFHVSGALAMIPETTPEIRQAQDLGISIFAGEMEGGRLDTVVQDAAAGMLRPLYSFLGDLPTMEGAPPPMLTPRHLRRTVGGYSSFDAGRGCPFQCSFCTIINVQGRVSRRRSPDDVERLVRLNWAAGIHRFFITDDNFARNKDWEAIFDRLIAIRRSDGMELTLIIQVDTLCHKLPNFIEKAAAAGVRRVFIGLESINPDSLLAAKKRQNRITEYRKMLAAWKRAGVITYAGYILGFPNDNAESIRRDIEIIKNELPLDILEFFFLTPLPGSEDHKVLWEKGVPMDPDLNKYDLEHACTAHGKMSKEEWERVYREAWDQYYSREHMETILRRSAAQPPTEKLTADLLAFSLLVFSGAVAMEGVHPLQAGFGRRMRRRERRPGMPLEPVASFYARFLWRAVRKHLHLAAVAIDLYRTRSRIWRDPARLSYTDASLSNVDGEDDESLELFTHTKAAHDAFERIRKGPIQASIAAREVSPSHQEG